MVPLGIVTKRLSLSIPERDGTEAILNLHTAPAAAYRIGQPAAAAAILEIAEAAAKAMPPHRRHMLNP
jgi:hypothetical protein